MKNSGFMLIDGGSNHDQPPDETDTFAEFMRLVAASTGRLVVNMNPIINMTIAYWI